MLKVKKAVLADLGRIMEIYRSAQDFMIGSGNPDQWGHIYPEEALIVSDIRDGLCHILYDESGIHGVMALCEGADPTYQYIENGGWLNDGPYVTIHRIAGDGNVHGIVRCAADYCKRLYCNIRIDTHAKNTVMQRKIEEQGFIICGIIYVEDGSARLAYQWTAAR